MTTTRFTRLIGLAFCGLVLASCASHDLQTSVKEKWNTAVRNYALVPVYPMVEHIYVGDMRVTTDEPSSYALSSRYIDRLPDIDGSVEQAFKLLPKRPETTQPPNRQTWRQPVEAKESPYRLHLAAFPNIALASIRESEFGASGTARLWNWIAGFFGRSEARLEVSVLGVETQELTDTQAFTSTVKYLKTKKAAKEELAFHSALCAAAASLGDPDASKTNLAIVTRVFYTRGIKYVYAKSAEAIVRTAAGEGDRRSLPDKSEEGVTPQDTGASENDQTTSGKLPDLADVDGPGVVARFVTKTAETLTLDEVFQRPMAFGADLMQFPLEKLGVDCTKATLIAGLGGGTTTLRQGSKGGGTVPQK